MVEIETLIEDVADLPSLPMVIQRLHTSISEEDISIREIAAIIETDQAFTARVLRLVNSPFYGLTQRISSVEGAITILGFDAVHQLLITTSVMTAFKGYEKVFNIRDFWKHSFGVGVIAKRLLFKFDKETKSIGFICGILHDMGRLMLVRFDPEKFIAFYTRMKMVTDLEAENEYFGIDHQALGEMLANKWNFPADLTTAIANHHAPLAVDDNSGIVSAVNIADMLCHALSIGDSCSYYVSEFFPEAWERLKLSMDELGEILKKALDEMDELEEMISTIS